jgi:SAM-dependent methyltransferase
MQADSDKAFTGSIPQLYDSQLVPLIFDQYAADLAARVQRIGPRHVLEIAAGTGAATRALAAALPETSSIVAIDLNQAMLDYAAARGTQRAVEWRQADAMALPFDDNTFDAVACQFAAMFFPNKAKAFAEARRVLKPGGTFIFSVWDRIEENEFADVVTIAMAELFPHDPPRFLARSPHGYFDVRAIERDVRAGGFDAPPNIVTLAQRSRAASARIPAVAYCQGTPLRNEIEARGADMLDRATDIAERAIARRFGSGAVDGKIQAHVIAVQQ